MNERFEKIAVEVFFDESTNEPGQKMYTFGELKMQKFAELIVRECLDVIAMRIYLGPAEICRQECKALTSEIKEHFGVEE